MAIIAASGMVVYGTLSINTVLLLIYNIDCPSSCCTRDLLYTVYSILYIVFAIAMRTLWVTCASLHPTYYTVSSAAFAFFVAFSFLFFFPPSVAFAFSLCFYPLVGSFVFVHPIFSCPADHVQYSTVQTVQYRIDNRVVEARSVKRTHTHTHIQSLIPPREDQCEWHRMTRMTGPDCVVMCNLINTHTHTPH